MLAHEPSQDKQPLALTSRSTPGGRVQLNLWNEPSSATTAALDDEARAVEGYCGCSLLVIVVVTVSRSR
jgi:hypothetical protein